MKNFNECGIFGDDYTYDIDIVFVNSVPQLKILQGVCGLNGSCARIINLNIMDILAMTESELADLNDCISNRLSDITIGNIYTARKHEVGLYLKPILPLFSYTKNNLMVELVYDENEECDGYCLRKVDVNKAIVIERINLSCGAARFIMKTILEFYNKNKDKVNP